MKESYVRESIQATHPPGIAGELDLAHQRLTLLDQHRRLQQAAHLEHGADKHFEIGYWQPSVPKKKFKLAQLLLLQKKIKN